MLCCYIHWNCADKQPCIDERVCMEYFCAETPFISETITHKRVGNNIVLYAYSAQATHRANRPQIDFFIDSGGFVRFY